MQLQAKLILHLPLRLAPPWLVMADGMDCARAHFFRQLRKNLARLAAAQDQAGVVTPKVVRQSFKRMVQPPTARPAHRVIARCLVVEDIDRDDRPRLCSGGEGRVIAQAQIAPQPDDLWFGQ